MFNSAQQQDEFVINMLDFKKCGYFLDIGSADATHCNNSKYFESLNWEGICIEFDDKYNNTYDDRNCKFLNVDALSLDYKTLFEENNTPKDIDYLSMDIDELSYKALLKLPFDEYKFKIITIEHDFYLHGDSLRKKQRDLLLNRGYIIICKDVLVEQSRNLPPKATIEPFEDWYIHPEFFSEELISKIKGNKEYPSDIIMKFKK